MLPANLVEDHLARAEWSWRLARVVERSGMIGISALGLLLLLGLLAVAGLVNTMGLAVLAVMAVLLLSGVIWGIVALVTMIAPLDRVHLGSELEKGEPRLMDRVHTLVHLEGRLDKNSPLMAQLSAQSAEILVGPGSGQARSQGRVLRVLGLLAGLTLLTAAFYGYFRPLDRIRAAELAAAEQRFREEERESLVIPEEAWLEEPSVAPLEEPWSEIRIRDPGRDLQATRFDLIPLVIEAYSTEPLREVQLTLHVHGRDPQTIRFPPSDDPHYAIHEYELDLLAQDVAEWDVISYYAESLTGEPRQTDLYFIDVLPTLEELESLPGGLRGEPYGTLQDLTRLLRRQQDALREEHRSASEFTGSEPPSSDASLERRFEERASEIAEQARKLARDLSARWDDAERSLPDQLRSIAESLELAPENDHPAARERTRDRVNNSLRKLAEARRDGDQHARQHAERFQDLESPPELPRSAGAQEQLTGEEMEQGRDGEPSRDERKQQLERLSEAREFVKQALRRERDLQRQASPNRQAEFSEFAERQRELREEFDVFCQQSEEMKSQAGAICEKASEGMGRAAAELENGQPSAREQIDQVAGLLQELDLQLESQQQQLQQRLQQELQELQQRTEQPELQQPPAETETESSRDGEEGESAENTDSDRPTGGRRDPRNTDDKPDNKAEGQAGTDGEGPRGIRRDPWMDRSQEAWDQAARQLESLQRREANGRQLEPQQEQRLRADAAARLSSALDAMTGANDSSRELLSQLRHELEQPRDILDWNLVRELMAQVERKRREDVPRSAADREATELRNIEPTRLPPAYRGAIERYFRNLSESP